MAAPFVPLRKGPNFAANLPTVPVQAWASGTVEPWIIIDGYARNPPVVPYHVALEYGLFVARDGPLNTIPIPP